MPDPGVHEIIARGLKQLNLSASVTPPDPLAEALTEYVRLLEHWNQRIGLTAVRDPLQMATRHILDSLAIEPWLRGSSVIDVGTGPGLPGIPLALARPDLEFTLLDSLAKRTTFIRQVIWSLNISNVNGVTTRVETYRPASKFDTLVTRAFASLEETVDCSRHLVGGCIVAMKGHVPDDEIAALEPVLREATQTHRVNVPGLDAQRCVVVVKLSPYID